MDINLSIFFVKSEKDRVTGNGTFHSYIRKNYIDIGITNNSQVEQKPWKRLNADFQYIW